MITGLWSALDYPKSFKWQTQEMHINESAKWDKEIPKAVILYQDATSSTSLSADLYSMFNPCTLYLYIIILKNILFVNKWGTRSNVNVGYMWVICNW